MQRYNMSDLSTNYIFIRPNRRTRTFVRGILAALAGGMSDGRQLCMVFLGEVDGSVCDDIAVYIVTRAQVAESCKFLFRTEVLPPVALKAQTGDEDVYAPLFGGNVGSARSVWQLFGIVKQFDFCRLNNGDVLTVVSDTINAATLAVYQYVRSIVGNLQENVDVRHVCECCYSSDTEERKLNRSIADCFASAIDSVVTGCRTDQYRTGMTLMQTITSVLDAQAVERGCVPSTGSGEAALFYTQENLNSCQMSAALCRMDVLSFLRKEAVPGDHVLHKWMERVGMTSDMAHDVWGESFDSMVDMYEDFIERLPADHFRVYRNTDCIGEIVKTINSSKTQVGGLTLAEKRCLRFNDIVYVLEGWIFGNSLDKSKVRYTPSYGIAGDLFDDAFLEAPSPAALWEITDLAFSLGVEPVDSAKKMRSFCLDLWEMFFMSAKTDVERVLRIDEHRLPLDTDMQASVAIMHTELGKMLAEQRLMYTVTDRSSGKCIAYSSPLTGFALNMHIVRPLFVGDKPFLQSGEVTELAGRTHELQAFIYNYIRCIGGFSVEFTDYVNRQLSTSLKHDEASRGRNLFKIYAQFGKHVGLERM